MDEAIHTGQHLGESAKGHELHDLDGGDIALLELGGELEPRIVLRLTQAEGNFLLFGVKVDNVDLDLVADLQYVSRGADAAPADLGDMDHAVHAANIDERAIGGQALDSAGVFLADLDLAPDLLGVLLALTVEDGADGADHALTTTVDLGDLEALGRADKLGHGNITAKAGLGRGDEHADAVHGHHNAALIFLRNLTLDNGALLAGGFDVVPATGCIKTTLGELRRSFHIVDANDGRRDLVADLDQIVDVDTGLVVGEFRHGDIAGMLGGKVESDLGGRDRRNDAGHGVAVADRFDGILKKLVKALFRIVRHGRFRNGLRNSLFFLLHDFGLFGHLVYYLLNNPRRRGSSGGDTDRLAAVKPRRVELIAVLHK